MKNLLVFILFTTCLSSCDPHNHLDAGIGYPVIIKNNSSQELKVISPFYNIKSKTIENINLFPDTSLVAAQPDDMTIIAGFSNGYIYFNSEYREVFESAPSGILSFYLFSSDTLNTYAWEEIRQDYKVLKRYDFTYHELEQLRWTITYP